MSRKEKQTVFKVKCFILDTKCNALKAASEIKEEADVQNSLLSEKVTPYDFDKIKCCINPGVDNKSKKTK